MSLLTLRKAPPPQPEHLAARQPLDAQMGRRAAVWFGVPALLCMLPYLVLLVVSPAQGLERLGTLGICVGIYAACVIPLVAHYWYSEEY